MHPKDLSIQQFNYNLPEDKIAKFPLENRDQSKLLVYKNCSINSLIFNQIHEQLPKNSFMIFNNTKVVEARLQFQNANGTAIEIFCLEPSNEYGDITSAMLQKQKVIWKCLVGKAKKWKPNETIILHAEKSNGDKITINATVIEKLEDCFLIHFNWNDDNLSFAEVLQIAGSIPLPPYLKREVVKEDKQTYQTTYAKHDGSVAAPTAGLHFTKEVFSNLSQKDITQNFVTLHVGAGTFKPVKSANMQDHIMHAEFIEVSVDFIERLIKNLNHTIVVVGTTSLRTIESLYWLGVKLLNNSFENHHHYLELHQWEAYDLPQTTAVEAALEALINYASVKNAKTIIAKTQIIIAPGYNLRIPHALITNFHQPSSTLILLVAAFVGKDWEKIYNYALENEYRFLSYGDSSLLWKNK